MTTDGYDNKALKVAFDTGAFYQSSQRKLHLNCESNKVEMNLRF